MNIFISTVVFQALVAYSIKWLIPNKQTIRDQPQYFNYALYPITIQSNPNYFNALKESVCPFSFLSQLTSN